MAQLHAIDRLASGCLTLAGPVATEENRDRFIFSSLVEDQRLIIIVTAGAAALGRWVSPAQRDRRA